MPAVHAADVPHPRRTTTRESAADNPLILPGVEVMREGRVEPFLHAPHWRQFGERSEALAACCGCRHEPALLCRAVHQEHRAHSAPGCPLRDRVVPVRPMAPKSQRLIRLAGLTDVHKPGHAGYAPPQR